MSVSEWRTRARRFLPWLLGASLVEWIGSGMFVAAITLYLVRVVGLSPGAVGVGLSIAGAVALLAAVPIGSLADMWGARRVLIAVNVCRGAATLCYLLVDGWWSFLATTTAVVVTETVGIPLTQAAVGERTEPELRTKVMGTHRTVLNLGMSIGGLLAGAAIATGRPVAYDLLFIADAAAFFVAAALLGRLTPVPGRRDGQHSRLSAFRDRRLLAIAAYDAVLTLWLPILNVAIPVWLATRTDAPVAMVGVLYAFNTTACIVLQLPISSRVRSPRQAWTSYALAGCLFAVTCVGFTVAPHVRGVDTVVVLVLCVAVMTIGELCQVSAAWTLSFDLAPADRRSQYLSAFGLGRASATRMVGPVLLTGVVIALGTAGWLLLATVFLATTGIAAVARSRLPVGSGVTGMGRG